MKVFQNIFIDKLRDNVKQFSYRKSKEKDSFRFPFEEALHITLKKDHAFQKNEDHIFSVYNTGFSEIIKEQKENIRKNISGTTDIKKT